MKDHLTVILGSGFSANAEMPTASKVNEIFDRDLRGKLLCYSSSEWSWIDGKSETNIKNGQLGYEHLAYSYIFNELRSYYIQKKDNFNNYEDFYQYIIDCFESSECVDRLLERATKSMLDDNPYLLKKEYQNYLLVFKRKQYKKVIEILNYLIADLLSEIKENDTELKKTYYMFIDYISQFNSVDIFTLNHDLLLEKILELNGLKYSKGFTTEGSPIICNGLPVPYFNNTFNENIKIHKLHGSLDFFQFRHCIKSSNACLKLTDKYEYFMTTDYSIKHNSIRIDPNTQEIVQDYNPDIVPKYITGTKKTNIINNDFLFKQLFQNFEQIMHKTDKLFISGYAFKDEHLNENLKSKNFNFINQNKYDEYPFGKKGINIKELKELKSFI